MAKLLLMGAVAVGILFLGPIAYAQMASSTPTSWPLTGMWAPASSSSSTPTYVTTTSPQASALTATQEINAAKYTAQTNTILLGWITVYGAEGYKIVRTGGSGGSITGYSRSADWTDSLPWGAGPTAYTYTVTALDVGGNEAATSTNFIYTAPPTPAL